MTVIRHMLQDLTQDRLRGAETKSISEDNYLEWQKFYTWEALTDQRYGQSFCKHFDVKDHRLYYERDWVKCDTIIRSEWLARP